MSRRAIGVYAIAATLVAGVGPLTFDAHAAALKYPKAGCFTVTDPKGDATFEAAPNNRDLDIRGFALESTRTDLLAFVKIDKLAAGPGSTDGARYTLDFTFNNHIFSASGSTYSHGSGAVRDGLAQTGQAGHTVQLGVDVPPIAVGTGLLDLVTKDRGFKTSKLKVTFDTKRSWVVFDLPIADIQKYGGAKFAGGLTAVDVKTGTDEYAVSSIWDTTAVANASTSTDAWSVGDNSCFPTKKRR
ncbi:MAG: hypothetical protein QOJ03_2429 [Frankiaceae bacterium]|jgi:hypothetical protein|nr:hypothetical protein [Frankiaceae bacterium]